MVTTMKMADRSIIFELDVRGGRKNTPSTSTICVTVAATLDKLRQRDAREFRSFRCADRVCDTAGVTMMCCRCRSTYSTVHYLKQ
jgi:hypothetical protein